MIDGGIIMIICVPIVAAFMGCYLYGSRIKHHREIEKAQSIMIVYSLVSRKNSKNLTFFLQGNRITKKI